MKADSFKGALILIFVVASLAITILVLTNTSKAIVYPNIDNIFVRGKPTAYSYNNTPPAPMRTYVQGDCPPMMMADQIGNGKVVASGIATECRLNPANDNFVALIDAIFQWLSSGKNVAWFNGYGVYCTSSVCDNLIKKKEGEGYIITPIDNLENLAPYDILVLPEMGLGSAAVGGDPNVLPDNDVQAIKDFVEGGGGLLIMCGSDFFGPGPKGNFYRVMNKILINLGFGYGGRLFGFQPDSVYDDVVNGDERSNYNIDVPIPGGNRQYTPIVDVNTAHPIGAAYQAATGRNTVRAYGACSLVEFGKGAATYIVPEFQVGMPGETLTYRFNVFNVSVPIPGAENVDSTIDLTVDDDSHWSPTLDNYVITVPEGENQTVILSVTIPNGTPLSAEDKIVVTATSPDPFTESFTCIACAGKRLEVTEDACVTDQYPEENFGYDTSLRVGRYENYWQYAYLTFDDLAEIPSGASITEARLYLFCWSAYGPPLEILCTAVNNDNWGEPIIIWTNKPALGAVLDTKVVDYGSYLKPKPYYWDVTSFVQQEVAGDKVASFCVRPADNCPPSTNRQFESKEWWDYRLRPFLQVIYTLPKVSVSISPTENRAKPGENVTFTVTVKNEGSISDTYSLTTADNASPSWSRTISPTSLPLAAGASGTATLTVTIPSGADIGTRDNVRVIATGTGVSAENSCTAHASTVPIPAVEVSISLVSQNGSPSATLTYTVTVTNTGSLADNYILAKSDNAGWRSTLSENFLANVDNGASRTVTLTVTIPENAIWWTRDNITVVATSQTDNTVSNSASCMAQCVQPPEPEPFVFVSPGRQVARPGEMLTYSVTVVNAGTTRDNFNLQVDDTMGWGPTLSITSTTLAGGASRTGIMLSVTIPENAPPYMEDNITVTATSLTDNTVRDSATCTAEALARGISMWVYVGVAVVIVVIIAAVLILNVV